MKDAKVLNHDPLRETETILREDFYGKSPANSDVTPRKRGTSTRATTRKPKPIHYKVVCISMYLKDIEALEEKVAELKRRGHTKANKSQLIRFALSQVDIDKLPPSV